MYTKPVWTHLGKPAIGLTLALGLASCITSPKIVGPLHHPISPASVRIFEYPQTPHHYTVVARLDATGYGGWSSKGVDHLVIQRLRKEAARLGANGVLLVPYGHFPHLPMEPGRVGGDSGTAVIPCCSHHTVKAEAILLPH